MHALPPANTESAVNSHLRRLARGIDIDLLARQVVAELPSLPAGHGTGRGNAQSRCREDMVRQIAGLITQWMFTGDEPGEYVRSELYEAARAAVVSMSAQDAFHACCATGRELWTALRESVPARDWGYLIPFADVVWASLDLALEVVRQAFDDQSDLPSSRDNRRAGVLFTRICGQSPVTIEDQDRAGRLGFPLSGLYCPFVMASVGRSAGSHAHLAARLRAGGALAFFSGSRVVGLTGPGFDWRVFTADGTVILASLPPVSRPELPDAVSELNDLVTLGAAAGRRGWIHPEDFLTEILLMKSPRLAECVSQQVFGRIEEQDTTGVLAQTLMCLAASGFDRVAAAAAFPVHRNTLSYRVSKIEKLTGLDLDRHADREKVRLASIWRDNVTETCDAVSWDAGVSPPRFRTRGAPSA